MKRSEVLRQAATVGVLTAGAPLRGSAAAPVQPEVPLARLVPPTDGVPVAFLLSDGAVMIDFAGPWEVFQDAQVAGRNQPAFNLFTVAETTKPLTISGGATIVPSYLFANAPAPKVVVVPAQSDPTPAVRDWLISTARSADLVMSVCTGALVLAQTGLLDGHVVTTHHSSFTTLAMHYPKVTVKHGVRFVDEGRIATSAGLSAGIDLALHVVARYYGSEASRQTAYDMEYQSSSWRDASNAVYRKPPSPLAGQAICPVCWMVVDPKTSPKLTYQGADYYFCMPEHEQLFTSAPKRFLNA